MLKIWKCTEDISAVGRMIFYSEHTESTFCSVFFVYTPCESGVHFCVFSLAWTKWFSLSRLLSSCSGVRGEPRLPQSRARHLECPWMKIALPGGSYSMKGGCCAFPLPRVDLAAFFQTIGTCTFDWWCETCLQIGQLELLGQLSGVHEEESCNSFCVEICQCMLTEQAGDLERTVLRYRLQSSPGSSQSKLSH